MQSMFRYARESEDNSGVELVFSEYLKPLEQFSVVVPWHDAGEIQKHISSVLTRVAKRSFEQMMKAREQSVGVAE